MNHTWKCFIATASGLMLLPGVSSAYEKRGQFSIDSYYTKDDVSGAGYNYLTARLKLDVEKFGASKSTGFHFDGRRREDLGDSSAATSIQKTRINTLNLDYSGTRYYLSVGRLWPNELAVELVDGFNAVYRSGDGRGYGVFAGAKPDPYTEEFNADYTTAGLYAYYQKESFTGSAALVHNGFKGSTDRQYLYGQCTYTPTASVMAFGTATADISPGGSVTLTNAITEVSYKPDFNKGVFGGFTFFRSFRLYKSSAFPYDDSSQTSVYTGGNIRFKEKYNLYGRVERQYRDIPLSGGEKTVDLLTAGVNIDNVLDTGFTADASYTASTGGGTGHNSYRADLSRLFADTVQLTFKASYAENSYEGTADEEILTYGASAYLYLSRSLSLSFDADREEGSTFSSTHILSRVAYRF